jgi:hypothetical protein
MALLLVSGEQEEFFRLADLTILNYTLEIVSAINDGYEGEPKNATNTGLTNTVAPTEKVSWSFSGAFLYSLTVITTIGEWNPGIYYRCVVCVSLSAG